METNGIGAIVTGASRGLGAELARGLAAAGAKVVLVARGREAVEAVAREIRERGGEAHALVADVGDKHEIHRVTGAAAALVGNIDIVVHNASELGPVPLGLLVDTECEDFGRVLEVNLMGPFRLTRAVAGSMMLRRRGLVIFVSSDAAVAAYPRWGAYGVSKAALDHMARIWAEELAESGVRFLSVDPGEMDTKMHADAMPEADRSSLARPAEVAARIVGLIRNDGDYKSGARVIASEIGRVEVAA